RALSARAHLVPTDAPGSSGCASIASLARSVLLHGLERGRLVAAESPERVAIALASASHPAGWGHQRQGLVLSRPGRLVADFLLPRAGEWKLWLQGQIMPAIGVSIQGRRLGSVVGQLAGNALVPDTIDAASARLSAGRHRLVLSRAGFSLPPGNLGP